MESQVPDKVVEAVTDVAPEGVRQQLREFFTTDLGHLVQIVLSVLLVVLLMVLIRNIAAHFLRRLEKRLRAQGNTSAALVGFCGHLLMGVIYICGAVSVLGVLSSTIGAVQDILNKLLAAGGIITVVAGLASQEALGSMVSGIMILVFKPFTLSCAMSITTFRASWRRSRCTIRPSAPGKTSASSCRTAR